MMPAPQRAAIAALVVGAAGLLLVIGALVSGRPQPSAAPSPSVVPTELAGLPLPPLPLDLEQNPRCGGIGINDLVLHGLLTQGSAQVWAQTSKGGKLRVFWPRAFRARFDPGLEVLTGDGIVLAREGDRVPDTWNGFYVCPTKIDNTDPSVPLDVFVLPWPSASYHI